MHEQFFHVYECNLDNCGRGYKSEDKLNEHINSMHLGRRPYIHRNDCHCFQFTVYRESVVQHNLYAQPTN